LGIAPTLKRLFTLSDPPAGLLFKGGTSLSKVFGVIVSPEGPTIACHSRFEQ